MKVQKIKFVTLFIFVIFILIETVSFATYNVDVKANEENQETIKVEAILNNKEQEALDLINAYRKQNGLSELKTSAKLQEIARLKAEDIVENEYFSHTSENLGTPFEMLKNNGVSYKAAGENLAGNISPERAVSAWINSEAHRDNILDKDFEYTGLCVVDSPIYGEVYVQLFIGI